MRQLVLIAAALAGLGGCQKAAESPAGPLFGSGGRGRYLGVGVYSPGRMWAQLVRSETPPPDPARATLRDDELVIVVVDSATGELRQCGNLSGYCITMNPWTGAGAQTAPKAPAQLAAHLKDLEAQDAARIGLTAEKPEPAAK